MTNRTHPDSGRIITSGDVINNLMDDMAAMEATHLRELAAYRLTVENLEREIAAITSETGNPASAQGAAITSESETQPAPALWVSPEQFANFMDADEAEFGKYIPARKTSAGKFTMPLFAARAPADSVQEDALSDSVRTPLDSLHADAAYLIGRLREGSMPYARVIEIIRERIDAAKAAIRASAAHGQAPAGATLPDGWVPLTITHEGQYPEEVAYGPQIMMDRLDKWLGKYFAQAAQADSQPAPVLDERDDFEKAFPLPSGCVRVGTGYAATGYSNWAAHTHCERWQGWQARAARAPADSVLEDAMRYRWLAAHGRSTSEHWGGRWSIVVDGPAPKSHDSEDDFDAAVDSARKQGGAT